MKKVIKWLYGCWVNAVSGKCEATLASKGAGTLGTENLNKKGVLDNKGEFNITLSYRSEADKKTYHDIKKKKERKFLGRDIFPSKQELNNIFPLELHQMIRELFP